MGEEERKRRDPWLNCPEVTAMETQLSELKEARRDANAKLEFDYSTQLTKDISAAERNLKKVTKKAKKAFKKGGGQATASAKAEPAASAEAEEKGSEAPSSSDGEAAELKKKIQDVKKKKADAAANDDFKLAKK